MQPQMKTTHRVDTTSQTSDDPGVDAPSADQLAQMESGDFLFAPAVRAALAQASEANARARAEVFRRLERRLLRSVTPGDITRPFKR